MLRESAHASRAMPRPGASYGGAPRDSSVVDGPVVAVPLTAFSAFVAGVRSGTFDTARGTEHQDALGAEAASVRQALAPLRSDRANA